MNIFCEYDRQIDIRLTFTAAFARILGTYQKGDELEKDKKKLKGDKHIPKFDRLTPNALYTRCLQCF